MFVIQYSAATLYAFKVFFLLVTSYAHIASWLCMGPVVYSWRSGAYFCIVLSFGCTFIVYLSDFFIFAAICNYVASMGVTLTLCYTERCIATLPPVGSSFKPSSQPTIKSARWSPVLLAIETILALRNIVSCTRLFPVPFRYIFRTQTTFVISLF